MADKQERISLDQFALTLLQHCLVPMFKGLVGLSGKVLDVPFMQI